MGSVTEKAGLGESPGFCLAPAQGSTLYRQKRLVGLAPLLLLTRDGARREVVEEAITRLEAAGKEESLEVLQLLAGLVFEKQEDRTWLEWRFSQMQEFFEQSWTYQRTVEKGRLQGIELGKAQGRDEGKVQGREEGMRQSIEAMVRTRFPALGELARERLEQIHGQEGLQQAQVALSAASTETEARLFLLALQRE